MVEKSAERPWGSWHVIDDGQGYKVKRIHVTPGQRLSYQTHQHRSEHWVVIFGIATCVVDGETVVAGPGESVDVPTGAPHRICNEHSEELIIIEVQHGGYTGEDDICRLNDDYGREDARAEGPATGIEQPA
ncbi:phosphomannose isomerase type II C-terminal cupin domain [Nocardioides pacificus]